MTKSIVEVLDDYPESSFNPANTELDPNGIDPHSPGAKLDAGKTQPELIYRGFARALNEVAEIGTFGAVKYSPDGWQSVPEGILRYRNANYRHRNAFYRGETHCPDSKKHHLAHAAWNALAELELMLREEE